MTAKTFKDLIVWQKAHQLVLAIYRMSNKFPSKEIYSLTSQLRRAAISIPANIAEGSLEEVRYYLILANDLNYADTQELSAQLDEVGRLLSAYHNAIISNQNR